MSLLGFSENGENENTLLEMAYVTASSKYEEATLAIFKAISEANPKQDFDVVFQVSKRALKLHIESLNFAEKIWAGSIPYDKAEASLIAQFDDFPTTICVKALNSAYVQSR